MKELTTHPRAEHSLTLLRQFTVFYKNRCFKEYLQPEVEPFEKDITCVITIQLNRVKSTPFSKRKN